MKKAFALIAYLAVLTLLLSACQADRQEPLPSPDRFVGVNVIAVQEDQPLDASRAEPHAPDGLCLLIPLDDAPTSEATPIGRLENMRFTVDSSDSGMTYSMSADLYVENELSASVTAIRIERVYQLEDGTLYAVDTGYELALPLADTAYYHWAETRVAAGEDSKAISENTGIALTVMNAPL